MRRSPPAAPISMQARMPASIAAPTSASVSPSITISSTQCTSGVISLSAARPYSPGQKAVVGRGLECRVLAADLRARAHDAAGERHDDIRQSPHRAHCGFGDGECRVGVGGEQQQVAATDCLGQRRRLLRDELAVHHRHAPVAHAVDHLRDLPAVAEEAQVSAERRSPRLRLAVAGRGKPANTAVVGQVSTHWPTRRSTCFASSLPDIEKISTE